MNDSEDDQTTRSDVEATAYRLLARRGHARGELARKLRKRDYPEALIEEVVERCTEAGYLDDEQFAREQGAILARKCWGPRQIRAKLRNRGVDDVVIDEMLQELENGVDWEERALKRLKSRFGSPAGLDDRDQKRAFRHLTYRGYSANLVRRLLFDYPHIHFE